MKSINGFNPEFVNQVVWVLHSLVNKALSSGSRPYGAALFRVPRGSERASLSMRYYFAKAHNRTNKLRNHIAHAEVLLLNKRRVAEELYSTVFPAYQEERSDYWLFTNAPPCPMCLTAIFHAQIRHTFYFVDTGPTYGLPAIEMTERRNAPITDDGKKYVVEKIELSDSALYAVLESQLRAKD